MPDPSELDALSIRRGFGRAAATYDSAAALQAEVRSRLLERLQLIRGEPRIILDAGAGTGHGSRTLRDRYPKAHIVALDFALPMLEQARHRQPLFRKFSRVCADAFALPLRDQTIDWCFSSLMLAWCEPIDTVLSEVRRVLKADGLFTFASLGPDTLRELRTAWAQVDDGPHVHRFLDMHDVGDALLRAGFAEPVMDAERIVMTFGGTNQLLAELKKTGLSTASRGRVRHLGARQKLRSLVNAYESQRVEGRLPVTFEIVYGHAWRIDGLNEHNDSGEVRIPLFKIGRR